MEGLLKIIYLIKMQLIPLLNYFIIIIKKLKRIQMKI